MKKIPLTNLVKRFLGRDGSRSAGSERDLREAIASLLTSRNIEFFESRVDGKPHFLFCVAYKPKPGKTLSTLLNWPFGIAWLLELPGKKLDVEQQAMFDKMSTGPNGWKCSTISSLDEAIAKLQKLGL